MVNRKTTSIKLGYYKREIKDVRRNIHFESIDPTNVVALGKIYSVLQPSADEWRSPSLCLWGYDDFVDFKGHSLDNGTDLENKKIRAMAD